MERDKYWFLFKPLTARKRKKRKSGEARKSKSLLSYNQLAHKKKENKLPAGRMLEIKIIIPRPKSKRKRRIHKGSGEPKGKIIDKR